MRVLHLWRWLELNVSLRLHGGLFRKLSVLNVRRSRLWILRRRISCLVDMPELWDWCYWMGVLSVIGRLLVYWRPRSQLRRRLYGLVVRLLISAQGTMRLLIPTMRLWLLERKTRLLIHWMPLLQLRIRLLRRMSLLEWRMHLRLLRMRTLWLSRSTLWLETLWLKMCALRRRMRLLRRWILGLRRRARPLALRACQGLDLLLRTFRL